MHEGAFTLLDCLGFKGVWNKGVQAEQILSFLKAAKKHSEESQVMNTVVSLGNVTQSLVFVSDTIAISTCLKTPVKFKELAAGYLVLLNVLLTAELCKRFAAGPVPLMFRGCTTFGAHIADDSFLLGPAVDEAATLAETSDGAFIWLTPTAQKLFRAYDLYDRTTGADIMRKMKPKDAVAWLTRIVDSEEPFAAQAPFPEESRKNRAYWRKLTDAQKEMVAAEVLYTLAHNRRQDRVFYDYPMAMKGGGDLQADVVNPLLLVNPSKYGEWIDRALSGFEDMPIGVLIKKQNTARFLNAMRERSVEVTSLLMRRQEGMRKTVAQTTGVSW